MVRHFLIHFKFDYSVWMDLFARFDMHWVRPWSVDDLFHQWSFRCKFVHGGILWKLMLYATFWKLWLESNNRIFRNKNRFVEEIVETIVKTVSEWVRKLSLNFEGIPLEDLILSWVAVLEGSCHGTSVQGFSWMPPLHGILKLNFDGSY